MCLCQTRPALHDGRDFRLAEHCSGEPTQTGAILSRGDVESDEPVSGHSASNKSAGPTHTELERRILTCEGRFIACSNHRR